MAIIGTVLALALAFQVAESANAPSPDGEQTLAHFLWYEHPINKGRMACDKSIRKQQESLFNRRFERRIKRLKKAYRAVHGTDPGLDVIPSLTCVRDNHLIKPIFARGMAEYEIALKNMERRFGLR